MITLNTENALDNSDHLVADTGIAPPLVAPPSAWKRRFQSLEFKSTIMVVLLIFGITAVGIVLSAWSMSDALYQAEFDHARELAQALAVEVSDDLVNPDREALRTEISQLVENSSIVYLAYANPASGILAVYGDQHLSYSSCVNADRTRLEIRSLDKHRVIEDQAKELYALELVTPVYETASVGGEDIGPDERTVIGYLLMAVDIAPVRAQLQRNYSQMLRLAGWMLLLVIPISLVITRNVVAPLNELARTVRAIANGAVDERAEVRVGGEIGELAEAFNTMTERVVSSHMELLRLNAELEQRVNVRTHELSALAACDPLTGLYNRRHFSQTMKREYASARRYHRDLTCLMFDLDHFKGINDRFGHRTGDEILVLVSQAIQEGLRKSDIGARFGGDEFVALLSQASPEDAVVIAERIRAIFGERLKALFPEVPTTLSVGIASLQSTSAESAEDLIHEADVALYAAKDNGRDQVVQAKPSVSAG